MTEPERADAVIRDDSATFVDMECHMISTTIPTAVYKKLPDKEERKLHPKTRFKAVVHLVMANAYWLGDVDGMALGSNARLNVLLLKKRGRKEKQKILTLQVD
ncbi:unnamed protein product [Timema podura]|uniref:Uncharacterized protein n=1 Tax=Timema podura TaxID=61482 RepID=A0ABN7PI19_TIMPD|nr:unnamed protein product [Timema podura]